MFLKKLTVLQIEQMRTLKSLGYTESQLSVKFGVSQSTVNYHVNPARAEKVKLSARKWTEEHAEAMGVKKRIYLKTPAGRKSIAKSWIRNYLKNKVLQPIDVQEVLNEFELKGEIING